jgi:hypothetical protein
MTKESFVAEAPYVQAHPDALAIYCSDGRFTEAIEQLLRHVGHPRIDTLTLPGGAALFNYLSAGFADHDALTRATTFLVRGHHIRRVVLLAHEGCGYYRARALGKSDEAIATQQLTDLRFAARLLKDAHSGLDVRLFFAHPREGRVVFDPVALDAAAPPTMGIEKARRV